VTAPSRHTSFSRPFNPHQPQEPSSPAWNNNSHGRGLSMIQEAASPHTSVVSHRSLERRSSRYSNYTPGESTRGTRRPSDSNSAGRRPSDPGSESRRPSSFNHSQRSSPAHSRCPSTANPDVGVPDMPQQSRRTYRSNQRRPSDPSADWNQPARPRPAQQPRQSSSRRTSESRSEHRPSTSSQSQRNRPSPGNSRHPSDRSTSSRRSRPSTTSKPSANPTPEPEPHPSWQGAYRGSRHSLGEADQAGPTTSSTSLTKRNSTLSSHGSTDNFPSELSRRPSRPKSLVLDDAPTQTDAYYSSRDDMMPTALPIAPQTPTTPTREPVLGRKPSTKGKVLRKKSLKRQEVVSYVG
jgi:hypothetical protein